MKVSLWKSASSAGRQNTGQSIRGKISGPIPIPNPIEEDFPMRHPGAGSAVPLGGDATEPQYPPPPPPTEPGTSTVPDPPPEATQTRNRDSVNDAPGAGAGAGTSPAPVPPASSPQRRTNARSTMRYSLVSVTSTQRTGTTSNKDLPQRKKSTLRGALSRLFGRKKKGGSQVSSERTSAFGGSSQHRSDPVALSRPAKDGEPKRSASLPITEFDRALRSHSVGPGDMTAIESARNSLNADLSFSRRRAATTTSQVYAPKAREPGELAGLWPRPASTHGRGSRTLSADDDPNEIGRAITSDSVGQRRRSRSLSGLPAVDDSRNEVRRRSDEIRYWRESYDPNYIQSPMSSNAPEGDDTGILSLDLQSEPPRVDRPKTPPQPFNFGSIASMNEMAGMKITQAASLETRIHSLEARMHRMEAVVSQLCNSVPGFRMHVDPPESVIFPIPIPDHSIAYSMATTAPVHPSLYQTSSSEPKMSRYGGSHHSNDSRVSFGEAPTFIGSLHPSTGQPPLPTDRPLSNSTVRGAASMPMLPREISAPFTADHYTSLLALIETERSARQVLEAQVKGLARTLHMVSASSVAGHHHHHSFQLEPPPTARSFGAQSAFDHDDDDDDDEENMGDKDNGHERSGSHDRPFMPEDSGIVTGGGDGDDETPSEDFATPREETSHGFGAFGEELRDDDGGGKRRKAARTLSLSQLTLGRTNPQARVAGGV